MVLRRRGFRLANLDNGLTSILKTSGGKDQTNAGATPSNQVGTNSIRNMLLYSSLHILSVVVWIICVVFAQTQFHTHKECDMTWSRRHFVELIALADPQKTQNLSFGSRGHNNKHDTTSYRVFKFMDHRDPRHRELLRKESVADESWCLSNQAHSQTVPLIVYVPGHFGSYEQSRSLGAHGTQLTTQTTQPQHDQAVIQKLWNLRNNHTAATALVSIDDFFFDVVAIDFREEGGGFHGAIIQRQAEFIANTIFQITQTCRNVKSLAIVAHSIGGISTRWALHKFPAEMAIVRNVVTLGTPHAHTVLSWQSTLRNMHRELRKLSFHDGNLDGDGNNEVALVSISGGLRDEIIPPMACKIENGLSLLVTDIMNNGTVEAWTVPVALGMDHRAIVWCHNLLAPVRAILFELLVEAGNQSVAARLARAKEVSIRQQNRHVEHSYDYQAAVRDIRNTLQDSYGYWVALALETSLLYHGEIVVHATLCIGAFRCLSPDIASLGGKSSTSFTSGRFLWIPSVVFSVLHLCYSLLLARPSSERDTLIAPRYPTILLLALVGDSLFLALGWGMSCLLRGKCLFIQSKQVHNCASKIWVLVSLLLLMCTALGHHFMIQIPWKGFFCAVFLLLSYIMGLAVIAVGDDSCRTASVDQQINFVIWALILLSVLECGDMVAIYKGLIPTWEIPVLAFLYCGQFWVLLTHVLRPCDPIDSLCEIRVNRQIFVLTTIGTIGYWVLVTY